MVMRIIHLKKHSVKGDVVMKFRFNPPTKTTFYISVVLVLIGLVGQFVPAIPFAFWFAFVGYVLLAAGLFVKGM
jgi:uncharacterized membrane protein HdeD (DUF308 family)